MRKRTHPRFQQQNYGRKGRSRVKAAWRKPRGIDNKKRLKRASAGAEPNIGWRNPRPLRGLHPSGLLEVLVSNAAALRGLDGKRHAVRIAAGVGGRKRAALAAAARQLGLRVLN
ncbi:MAG: eL32 family ribosomal protein [Candidatus Micrarchaeia archaeon]